MENQNQNSMPFSEIKDIKTGKKFKRTNIIERAKKFYVKSSSIIVFALFIILVLFLWNTMSGAFSPSKAQEQNIEEILQTKHAELIPLQANLSKKIEDKKEKENKVKEIETSLEQAKSDVVSASSDIDSARKAKNDKEAEINAIINPESKDLGK